MTDALTPKPFIDIISDLIAYARATTTRITDYNVGSVARTLLEAPAIEIDTLHQAYIAGLLEAIPTAIFEGFGFTALSGVAATGLVTFATAAPPLSPIAIPAGTTVRDPLGTVTYETQTSASISSLSATVRIAATTIGAAGNAIAGALTAYSPAIADVTVTNIEPILGGAEPETADEQRQRFARYIQSLARGTVASLEYAALSGEVLSTGGLVMERVTRTTIEETAGHVNVYIFNGAGDTSNDLVSDVQRRINGYWDDARQTWVPGYRPAGMRVDVHTYTEQPLAITLEVDADTADQTATLTATIEAALTALLVAPHPTGVLRTSDILSTVIGVAGVNGAVLLAPTTATPVPANTILTLETLTLTWT